MAGLPKGEGKERRLSSRWLEQVGLGDEVTFVPETSTSPHPPYPRSLPAPRGQVAGRGGDGAEESLKQTPPSVSFPWRV